MTPGARVAAAISVLDAISDGQAAEQALTRWARASRFAGSGDRAAVRDHVFDVLRRRRSVAARGGGATGRALMLGLLREQGVDPETLFTGEGHAPAPLTASEQNAGTEPGSEAERWNLPDWLAICFRNSLGTQAETTARALQDRAPVTLRVNTKLTDAAEAAVKLDADGVGTRPLNGFPGALLVTEGARRLRGSQAYTGGLVELQDAASQAVVSGLPPAARCLDYCAGGGGKSLALAADPDRTVTAHDISPGRMRDLPARAERAQVRIKTATQRELVSQPPFDLVLCDAPCSGSGSWRRAPEAKWSLTPERLQELQDTQAQILAQAAALTSPGGWLIYVTCSVLPSENEDSVGRFLAAHPEWRCNATQRFDVTAENDGFFSAHLTR
ncbi:RsmB/NOP family class I SAM-dependent RNA methyltransferase [uncultured Roseobacter sp.]|uniref:RsmB/NOP family class I SAM-dependent RNA methyltransferase n=1 Tax=uncultured Roseobacter sp. TaxID=114847 RepID=UPI002629A935|nr:RsmB/NOP family class I SAM-dependent RNA methyltransferase [uncultured Roseobacter sp.]